MYPLASDDWLLTFFCPSSRVDEIDHVGGAHCIIVIADLFQRFYCKDNIVTYKLERMYVCLVKLVIPKVD